MIDLAVNLASVRERIASAACRVGRAADEVTLVAVTKGQPLEGVRAAYDLGLRHLGENRVEEAEAKVPALPGDVTWHMIGHIQGRKAKRVPPLFRVVHSLDSLELALRLDRLCAARPEPLAVLLEVNVSGEESKDGFAAHGWSDDVAARAALWAAVERIVALRGLHVQGLMTIAPLAADPEEVRPVFADLRRLRDELRGRFPQAGWQHLSMGMSDDFEVAVEEGATLVRVGRAIFDPDLPSPPAVEPTEGEPS